MNVTKLLHNLSHLKWIFMAWVIVLIIYVFVSKTEDTISMVGNVIFFSGIMMGLSSLSDVSKLSKKTIQTLSNPTFVKTQFRVFFGAIFILLFISLLFHSTRFFLSSLDEEYLNSFSKLGNDCLVMMLGFLCLIKQFQDQVEYAKSKA